MLRTSSYTIYVDLPEGRDEVLLIHGFSGAYDKVSEPVARYLRELSRGQAEPPESDGASGWRPRPETLETLKRRGYLTTRTRAEEEALFARLGEGLAGRERQYQPGYILMLTYKCNLRCPYCFQGHMRTDPANRHLLRSMKPEVIDRIFAAMPVIEERNGLPREGERARSVHFFGGEPLLAHNRPLVEHVFRRAADLGGTWTFAAITNGTDLDAYADLLGPGKIGRVQITLDGPPAEHDLKRAYPDGAGSFAKIAANISLALDRGTQVSVRMNIDRTNLAWLPRMAEEIAARGWRSYKHFAAYVAPVHAAGAQGEEETILDSWELRRRLQELQREHPDLRPVGDLDDGLHRRLQRIFADRQNPMPSFKTSFCGAHTTMYIFDAFGDIYACWEQTGDRGIRIGSVGPDGGVAFEEEHERRWRSRTVLSNPVCRRCRYAFYCGGGCAHLAWRGSGDLHRNFCDGFAHRFRATAARAYLDVVAGQAPGPLAQPSCDQ